METVRLDRVFAMEGGPFRVLSALTRCLVLSVLVLVCSVGVVTFGAAMTAGYAVLLRDRDEADSTHRLFFRSFRAHLRGSTAYFVVSLAVLAGLAGVVKVAAGGVLELPVLVLAAFVVLVSVVWFPLRAASSAGWVDVLRGAVGIVMRYGFFAMAAAVGWAILLVVPVMMPKMILAWMFLAVGLGMLLTVSALSVPMRKFVRVDEGVEFRAVA